MANRSVAFGVATGDALVRARAAGQDVMAVSSIYRYNPTVIMALSDSAIQEPQALEGKVVGVTSSAQDASSDVQLLGLLDAVGISPTQVSFAHVDAEYAFSAIVTGQMDAVSGVYATQAPVWGQTAGYTTTLLFLRDYGILVYPNLIFTTEELVDTDPDLIRRFVLATLKGYQYALEHPDVAAELAVKYNPTLDVDAQLASMQAQIPYIDTGVPLGTMDLHVWQSTQFLLLEQELIPSIMAVGDLYTNKFIPSTESVLNVQP
jgi:ABC-type nitrate/sulfonate/bicarbonate transport system substrate-binding protein